MSGHFIGLFVHEFCFGSQDLLVTSVVVLFTLFLFELRSTCLYLVCFLVVLLLGEITLDSLQIQ